MAFAARPANASEAFTALADIVEEWRTLGRKTTTAGLKPAFQESTGGMTERDFGFPDWRSFVQAAEAAGTVRTQRLRTGHVAVLLPNEPFDSVEVDLAANAEATAAVTMPSSPSPAVRLRPDVWIAFVDWQQDYGRIWDPTAGRASMFPLDQSGAPALTSEPERFVEIKPVSPAVQHHWMLEWADQLPPTQRDLLVASLAPDAETGAFRRELNRLGLGGSWREELQGRVVRHVREWTENHRISFGDLLDRRPAPHSQSQVPPKPKGVVRSQVARSAAGPATAGSEVEVLRARLHRIIDRMSLSELSALPIRAEHLLDD